MDRQIKTPDPETIEYKLSSLEAAAMIIGECTSDPALKLAMRSFEQWRNRTCDLLHRKRGMPIEQGSPREPDKMDISYEWGSCYELDLSIELGAPVRRPQRGPTRHWRRVVAIIGTVVLGLFAVDFLVLPEYRTGVAMALGVVLASWFIRRT